jgi:hypothetical protein
VIPSSNEGGPLTAYEAQLVGTRLASTNVGVVPEVLAVDPHSIGVVGHGVPQLRNLLAQVLNAPAYTASERENRKLNAHIWTTETNSKHFYSILRDVGLEVPK